MLFQIPQQPTVVPSPQSVQPKPKSKLLILVVMILVIIPLIFAILYFTAVISIDGDGRCDTRECSYSVKDCVPAKCVNGVLDLAIGENCQNSPDANCSTGYLCKPERSLLDEKKCYKMVVGDDFCDSGETTSNACYDCGCPWCGDTEGVKIKKFRFENTTTNIDKIITTVFEKQSVSLRYEIKNVASKKLTSLPKYWVYGPDIGMKPDCDESTKWCVDLYSELSGVWTQESPLELCNSGGSIEPGTWLIAPEQPAGVEWPYTFFLRVCYPYSTTVTINLTYDEAKGGYISSGTLKPTEEAKRQAQGPIKLDIPTGTILTLRGSQVGLQFNVDNVGGGFSSNLTTCESADVPIQKRNIMEMIVSVDGKNVDSCNQAFKRNLFRQNVSKDSVTCSYDIGVGVTSKTLQLTAKATYTYFVDAQTKITVKSSTT